MAINNYAVPTEYQGAGRKEVISSDEAAMILALATSIRSFDPTTQVGAVIYRGDEILGTGFNHPPKKWRPERFTWLSSASDNAYTKYAHVIHAEYDSIKNALKNGHKDFEGATMAVTLFPCLSCATAIADAGISRLIYLHKRPPAADDVSIYTKFYECGIEVLSFDEVKEHDFQGVILDVDTEKENHIQYSKVRKA